MHAGVADGKTPPPVIIKAPALRSRLGTTPTGSHRGFDAALPTQMWMCAQRIILAFIYRQTIKLLLQYNPMEIVWDEPKRLANVACHGLDFADLDDAFFEGSVIVPAKLGRQIAIGRHRSGMVLVVFVALGTEGLSVVSMRPASRKERRLING
jgi:uncharacterized DUF497 family protein